MTEMMANTEYKTNRNLLKKPTLHQTKALYLAVYSAVINRLQC